MAKKKKKEKVEKREVKDSVEDYALDSALKTSKNTESTLHNLLDGLTEEFSFLSSKKEEGKIEPRLTHERKKEIVEEYMMEQVPLSERGRVKDRKPIGKSKEVKTIQTEVIEEDKLPRGDKGIQDAKEPIPKVTSTIKEPSFTKKQKDNIYGKLSDFFEELFLGYNERYDRWENSISSILSILRKMRKITKKNTEDLVVSINNLHDKIQHDLEQFEIKRDEVKKITNVDVESMSSEFKRVLGLLELQIKEYQLKRLTDEYIREQSPLR